MLRTMSPSSTRNTNFGVKDPLKSPNKPAVSLDNGTTDSMNKWTRAASGKDKKSSLMVNLEPSGNKATRDLMEASALSEIQRQTKQVQNDSLASSTRALKKVIESEKIAGKNLGTLRVNSEQLSRVEGRLDEAAHQARVSNTKTEHLKSLNRLFFLPSFTGKKAKKIDKIIEKDRAEIQKRNDARNNLSFSRGEALSKAINSPTEDQNITQVYTTPENIERDETEVQIDENLSGITKSLGKLKVMGQAMSQELDLQNKQVENISSMTENADSKIRSTNKKVYKLITK